MNIRLLGDRLIVRPIPRTKSGMIELPQSLHDSHVNGPKEYYVMVVGPGRRTRKGVLVPPECEYGDRVICHAYDKGPEVVTLPFGDMIVTNDQILMVLPK